MKSELNCIENFISFSAWITSCLYALYAYRAAQSDIIKEDPNLLYSLNDLKPGWSILSRLKDESDIEWSTLLFYIHTSWFYIFLQFMMSELIRCRSNNTILLKCWYILSSTLFVVLYMGFKHMLLLYAQPMLFLIIMYFGGRKLSIWVTSILLLASYNSFKNKYSFWYFLDTENVKDEQIFLILFGIAWVELRCISFCVDYIDKKKEQKKTKVQCIQHSFTSDLIDILSYVLYLPVLYVGPIILYEEFNNSFTVTSEKLSSRLKRFAVDMALFTIYTMLLELSLHYMYFYAMQSNLEAIKQLPTLALIGGGLWMGFQFHAKYVVSYGSAGAYARLDHVPAPPAPRCIARIHLYSHMWRYFDVGLYRFLFKYIYKPLFSTMTNYMKLPKIAYKLISSLLTFIFIFVWHGTMWSIFMWCALNYIGILIEFAGKAIGKTERYRRFKENVLKTDAMEVRFISFISAPLLGYSILSSYYLFGGTDIGNLYFGLLKWPTWHNFLFAYFALYCSCHVGIALRDVPSRTDVKRVEKKES